MIDSPEQSDGGNDVDGGDDEFLDTEPGELDSFHDVELVDPEVGVGRVATIGEDDGRKMQDNGVDNDQSEYVVQSSRFPDDEVQTRIKHECLACNHTDPSHLDERQVDKP